VSLAEMAMHVEIGMLSMLAIVWQYWIHHVRGEVS
jgi:hypothetical protein